jgi:hypothetical protein
MATVRIDSLIKSIATALDIVEGSLLGASTNHGKRIAVLCAKMGRILGKNPEEISALAETICQGSGHCPCSIQWQRYK